MQNGWPPMKFDLFFNGPIIMSTTYPLMISIVESLISRGCLFALSIFIITHASRRVVKEEKENSLETEDNAQNLTWWHVLMFPFLGSAMLLVLFYFFEYIQLLLMLLTIVLSVVTISVFVYPFLKSILKRIKFSPRNGAPISVDWSIVFTVSFSVFLSIAWMMTNHWILLDFVGVTSATFMILFVRIPNLKVATIFLILLLFYDVFWVFLSSSLFQSNVMVEVAEKKAKNPIAVVAEKVNMPSLAQSQPSLALPGKLIVPSSFTDDSGYSMLGLGDVVLPGMLLCLAMRFDSYNRLTSFTHTSSSYGDNGGTFSCCQWKTYFSVAVTGYTTGLFLATLMVELFQYPQPALLYLVPSVLFPLFYKSYQLGHLQTLWTDPFNTQHNSTRVAAGSRTASSDHNLPI